MTTPLTLTTRGPAGSGWNCSPYGPDSPHNVYHAPISLLGLAQDNHQSVNGEYLARAWTWAGHQRYDNAGQSSPSVAHGALHFPSVQSSSSRLVALTETHPVYDTDSCETSAQSSQPFSPSITSLHRQLPPPNITTLQPSPTSRDAAKFVGVGQGKIKLEAQHASPTASHSAFSSHPRHGIWCDVQLQEARSPCSRSLQSDASTVVSNGRASASSVRTFTQSSYGSPTSSEDEPASTPSYLPPDSTDDVPDMIHAACALQRYSASGINCTHTPPGELAPRHASATELYSYSFDKHLSEIDHYPDESTHNGHGFQRIPLAQPQPQRINRLETGHGFAYNHNNLTLHRPSTLTALVGNSNGGC